MSEWELIQNQINNLSSVVQDIAARGETANPIDTRTIEAAERAIQEIEKTYGHLVSQIPTLREHLDQTHNSLEDLKQTLRAEKKPSKEDLVLLKERMHSVLIATFPELNEKVLLNKDAKKRDDTFVQIALTYAARGNWTQAKMCTFWIRGFMNSESYYKVLEGIYDKLYLQLRETGPSESDECKFLYDLATEIRIYKRGGVFGKDTAESIHGVLKLMPLLIKHGDLETAKECNSAIRLYDRALAGENEKLIDAKKKEIESKQKKSS